MFLKISHNLQDNACTWASFSTKGPSVYSFIKKKLRYRYIFVNFAIFLNTTFLQNTYKRVPGGQIKGRKLVHLQSVPKIRQFLHLAQ